MGTEQGPAEGNGGTSAPAGDVADLQRRIVELERVLKGRNRQLEDVSQRLRRLERRIDRASASFPVRTALRLRRRLHRLLKSTPS